MVIRITIFLFFVGNIILSCKERERDKSNY